MLGSPRLPTRGATRFANWPTRSEGRQGELALAHCSPVGPLPLISSSFVSQQLPQMHETTHSHARQVMAAAAHVMESTIDHIDSKYGSTHNYLKSLGLTEAELQRVVAHLTHPGMQLPATAATDTCEKR